MTNTPSAPTIKEVLSLKHTFTTPLSIIPLLLETKLPAVRWKTVIDGEPFTDDEVREHWARFRGKLNPGIATGRYSADGLIVIDLDNAAAVHWAHANLPATRMKTISLAGESEHWYYRIPGGKDAEPVKNMADVLGAKKRWEWEAETKLGLTVVAKQARGQSDEEFRAAVEAARAAREEAEAKLELGPVIDVRGDGGQVVAPGAIHPSGRVYAMDEAWSQAMLDTVPFFDPDWFAGKRWRRPGSGPISAEALKAKIVDDKVEAARTATTADEALKRASAWIQKADPSVSGAGGHNQAFYVACRLVCGFNLDVDTAYHLMKSDWNEGCQPPWSDEELAHKVMDAEKQRGQNDGYMLVDRPEFKAARKVRVVPDYEPPSTTTALARELDDDEFFADHAEGDSGSGAPPPPAGAPPGGGGGGSGAPPPSSGAAPAPASAPMSDDDRYWQRRWDKPFGVDYMGTLKGKGIPWTPLPRGSAWVVPPFVNNLQVVLRLSRHIRHVIRRNELKLYNEIDGQRLDDGHILRIKRKLDDLFGTDIPRTKVDEAVELVARENVYEPVQDWIQGLPAWDGTPRLETVPAAILGSSPEPVQGVMFRHTMVGLVARIMEPGTKVDHITFLVGPQGAGKSKFWRLLIDGHLRGKQWFTDAPFNLNDKDGRMLIGTNVLVEWSEGEHAKSALKIDRVKGFLSQQEDEFRPPYGKHVIERERRCLFVATSNDAELLHDATGSRRFYIIKTSGAVDLDALLAIREQLFAEALVLYLGWAATRPGDPVYEAGRWWFTAAEDKGRAAAVAEFQARSPWHEDIEPWIEERVGSDKPEFTIGEVIENCVRMDRDKKSKRVESEVRHTLLALGCRPPTGKTTVRGKRARWWSPPADDAPDDDLPL